MEKFDYQILKIFHMPTFISQSFFPCGTCGQQEKLTIQFHLRGNMGNGPTNWPDYL